MPLGRSYSGKGRGGETKLEKHLVYAYDMFYVFLNFCSDKVEVVPPDVRFVFFLAFTAVLSGTNQQKNG